MKTYLFYFGSCFNMEFMGELLDEAVKLSKDENNKVYFLSCSGVNQMCGYNVGGSKLLCKWCSFCTKKCIQKYSSIKFVPLTKYLEDKEYQSLPFSNAQELRYLSYRGAQIGLGIMSSYISRTRNMNPKMDESSKPYFEKHVIQNMKMVDALYNAIEELKPDSIYSYNGRFEENRAVYDIGMALALETVMQEDYTDLKNLKKYKVAFVNALPHKIPERSRRYKYTWDHYNMTEEEKIELGKSFYIKRRGGERSGDVKIYIAGQHEGMAPKFDKSKINIAIMNSSEDEYAAVGDEWDKLKMFKTQYEGIVYLLEHSPENYHFYLRIHPNLMAIPYKYHHELLELKDKYKNITVIPGDSEYSTYTIMEQCDKVIGFGSTMCIEASYWGKPSILLGPAVFYFDDVCYVPKSPEEAIEMLGQDLKPKDSNNILKFGAYTMDTSPCAIDYDTQYKFVDYNEKSHRFIKKYTSAPFVDFFGGEKKTALIIAVMRQLLAKNSFSIPVEEV